MTLAGDPCHVITYGHKKSDKAKLTRDQWQSIVQTPIKSEPSSGQAVSSEEAGREQATKTCSSPLVDRWRFNGSLIRELDCQAIIRKRSPVYRHHSTEELDELWDEIRRNLAKDR
jgi:hypothetical protein